MFLTLVYLRGQGSATENLGSTCAGSKRRLPSDGHQQYFQEVVNGTRGISLKFDQGRLLVRISTEGGGAIVHLNQMIANVLIKFG